MSPPEQTRATQVVVEVTDTLGIDFTTGIQRVVRELIHGMEGPAGAGLEVVPVVTPSREAGMRRLTPEEAHRLDRHPAGGRAGRRADDFGVLAPLARRFGDLPITIRLREMVRDFRGTPPTHPLHPELAFQPPPGSVFLDLEGSWYDPVPRAELLPRLHADGVTSLVFVHDVMPVVHPEWFTPRHIAVFRAWLDAHLQHSPTVLVNSERTGEDLRAVARSLGRSPEVVVVPLGADAPSGTVAKVELPAAIDRFLLVVGTLEPRKNLTIVLDAFDRLRDRYPGLGLVLVGKEGWMVDDLVARIRRHPEHGERLLWLGGVGDAELAWLYDHAHLCVAPSRYEGLGVPVLEALGHGCATLSSTGGALPEAAGDAAELFDPDDLDALTALIVRHLDDPTHHEEQVSRARAHGSPTWADSTEAVVATLRRVTGAAAGDRYAPPVDPASDERPS